MDQKTINATCPACGNIGPVDDACPTCPGFVLEIPTPDIPTCDELQRDMEADQQEREVDKRLEIAEIQQE